MALDFSGQARPPGDALEPLAGGVYVAPEAYAADVAHMRHRSQPFQPPT